MNKWGVTDSGYKLLEETGLDKRIEEKWNYITMNFLPHGAILNDWEVEELLEKDLPAERREIIKKWKRGKTRYEQNPEGLFMVSGTITDEILSKEERSDYKRFNVKSLSQLDGLLAAFCLTKHRDSPLGGRGRYYVWRSEGLKTQIYGNIHGDLQIHQFKTKTEDETQLFGDLPQSHINAYYDYWPVLVGTGLKYADTVGIEIPEAQNWREFMKKYGWDGRITKPTSGWGVGYDRFVNDYREDIIAQLPDKTNIREVKKMFFGIMRPESVREVFYLPVIDEKENLVFYVNYGNDESVELAPHGEPVKYSPRVHIPKSNASHLFKGAVNGIMTHQSRTRPEILAFMLWEYDQIKAGKSEEEIREKGYEFESF